jgi:hypothetical protein
MAAEAQRYNVRRAPNGLMPRRSFVGARFLDVDSALINQPVRIVIRRLKERGVFLLLATVSWNTSAANGFGATHERLGTQ